MPAGREGASPAATAPAQHAVIVRDAPGREALLLQTTYRGPAERFAWVVPVPGLPRRGDVFRANPRFLDAIDKATRPQVRTMLTYPFARGERFWGARLQGRSNGRSSGAEGPTGPVVVHDRMEVGDYDVAVLSAPRPGFLQRWLAGSGFQVPEDAGPVLDGYSRRGWHFVAVRIRPKVARAQPLLRDAAPLGIRFPARDLVFPLAISRVSAPAITRIELVVLDTQGVESVGLPTVFLPLVMSTEAPEYNPGHTYTQVVGMLLDRYGGKALLCEHRDGGRRYRPYPEPDSAMLEMGINEAPLDNAWQLNATRFYGEVPREAMVDLHFRPRAEPYGGGTTVQRLASVPMPWWSYVLGTTAGQLFLTLLGLFAAMWAVRPPHVGAAPACLRSRTLLWMAGALAGGAAAFLVLGGEGLVAATFYLYLPVVCVASPPLGLDWLNLWTLAIGGATLLGLVRATGRRSAPDPQAARVWRVAGVLLGFGFYCVVEAMAGARVHLPRQLLLEQLPVCALSVVLWALLFWSIGLRYHTRRPPKTADVALERMCLFAALALVTFGAGAHMLCESTVDAYCDADRLLDVQEERIAEMTAAVARFRDATGAYPARLDVLTASKLPTDGLDASGNPALIAGALRLPLLKRIPDDPLTGRPNWVYDVRSPRLIESGGYRLHIEGW